MGLEAEMVFGAEAAQELSSCREQRNGEEGNGNSLYFGLGEKSCDSPFLHLSNLPRLGYDKSVTLCWCCRGDGAAELEVMP